MKRIYIFCSALIVLALFAACSEKTEEQQESKPECYIHYTADTLDETSFYIINNIDALSGLPKTQEEVDSAVEALKGYSYEEYSGTAPEFHEGTTVDTLYDENGFITLKITRPCTEEGAKLPACNILYTHGGGFLFAFSHCHVNICEAVAERMNATVYAPLYPLAPNYYVQTTLDMLLSLYRTIRKVSDLPLYTMGDSAGANLTLSFPLYLKSLGEQLPDAMFPISPYCDFDSTNPEYAKYAETDILLKGALTTKVREYWRAADIDIKDPRVSPQYGDWKDMPQTFIFVGTDECLYPEIMVTRQNMEDAGMRVGMLVGKKLFHIAPLMIPWLKDMYIDEVIEFLYGNPAGTEQEA